MSNEIRQHTEELRRERLANQFSSRVPIARISGRQPLRQRERQGTGISTFSEMDPFVKYARMPSSNAGSIGGGWSVSSKLPQRAYQPMLRDTYPRNEFTMMPVTNGPKYYTGHFLKYDFKDQPKAPELDDTRPVVFKTQTIERVQTKKKYGHNLKGESSVPLHLCNDPTSLLYQRSLQPDTRSFTTTSRDAAKDVEPMTSKLHALQSTISRYPYALHKDVKNDASVLNPLNYGGTTQTWINTSFPTGRNRASRRVDTASTQLGGLKEPNTTEARPSFERKLYSAPEWYSEFFPREKVAATLKFMGQPKTLTETPGKKDFVIDFNNPR